MSKHPQNRIYTRPGDTIKGDKIYCVFERFDSKPKRVSTGGRHNAQSMTISGNPAIATIKKKWRFLKE